MVKYPKVDRSHIVPRVYLRGFADDHERIALRSIDGGDPIVTSIDNAAVRRAFYRRTRRDGTEIDDIEWALSHLEGAVAPILRELEARWPLCDSDKTTLGEFTALQLLRSPRWRKWHDRFLDQSVDGWRRGEDLPESAIEASETELAASIERVASELRSDTQRHVKMLALIGKTASILGSMHWTLLRFPKPLVACSDHPVHVWPLERGPSRPTPGRIAAGLLPTLEVRVPTSAHTALLMTWLANVDTPDVIVGNRQFLRNLNAFTLAEAERQWFHRPGVSPPSVEGVLYPLSMQIYPGYDERTAVNSPLRQEISRRIQPRIGQELTQGEKIEIVRVRRKRIDS